MSFIPTKTAIPEPYSPFEPDLEDMDLVPETPMSKDAAKKSYTFSASGQESFGIYNYVIQKYLAAQSVDSMVTINKEVGEYEYDLNTNCDLMSHGQRIFSLKDTNKLISCSPNREFLTISLTANFDISEVVAKIKHEIKWNNPIRRKNIQILQTRGGFRTIFKPIPKVSFKDVILDKTVKDDIYDNTIYQLKNVDGNNGIIMHGCPGTGKSTVCQAIISETIKEGFSTCYLVDNVDWSMFKEFIQEFLTPCVIVFEDIDSLGQNREDTRNSEIAAFLQFLNGLNDTPEKMVFVATTNYLQHLDKAINNRPVRFNRKFEFVMPSDSEIDLLIDLCFKKNKVPANLKRKCHGVDFSGAHIREIARTAELLSKKNGTAVVDCFEQAVKSVSEHFSVTLKSMGFGS